MLIYIKRLSHFRVAIFSLYYNVDMCRHAHSIHAIYFSCEIIGYRFFSYHGN